MITTGAVDENLHFLILEVTRQVERTRAYLRNPSGKIRESIVRRDDYIDHLRTIIQRKCFAQARGADREDRFRIEFLKSLDLVTGNLEHLADHCENIVGQSQFLASFDVLDQISLDENFDTILDGLEMVESALKARSVHDALAICRVEARLDELYAATFKRLLARLDAGGSAHAHVTALLIAHYFERMGDCMLNVGEAILSAALGERIKIDQYRALADTIDDARPRAWLERPRHAHEQADLLSIEALGETRSGCRIDRVSDRSGDKERMVVFKEGRTAKLLEEKRCVDRWNAILPGYAPLIYSFQEREGLGAILFEYLPGRTFEEMVLRSEPQALAAAATALERALGEIWTKTRLDEPTRPRFFEQLAKRLDEVYALHPAFRSGGVQVGPLEVLSLDSLLERATSLDERLAAPFSVLGHGDLNVDNVIYDHGQASIRFIDLHRSQAMDYAQDVSVFLVSNFRLQVFDRPVRARIHDTIRRMLDFARDYASKAGDPTFEARLAAGLARSFTTSARFVLAEEFAMNLFFRGRFLIEQLSLLPESEWSAFRIPEDVLVD
ncbi:MAG: PhoU domain-containing protein [Myxococcota bacterium]